MGPHEDKKKAFEVMLEQGMTMLHLDARKDGVDVPAQFRSDHHLRLNFSYRFQLDHFMVGAEAVEASLSFGGTSYLCVVPWDAVFAMTCHPTGEWKVWSDELPPELVRRAAAMSAMEEAEREEQDFDDDEPAVGGAVRKVGHLRVIK